MSKPCTTHLCTKPKGDEHEEEEHRPELRDGQLGDHLGVHDEREPRALRRNLVHRLVKLVCHVADDAEDDEAGENAGNTVHDGHYNGVPGI